MLIDALNLVTGNLDRPGGAVFGRSPIDIASLAGRLGLATYDSYRSRVGNLPEVLGELPAALMAAEIETPGPGQLRALIVSAGNPVLSVPNGRRLSKAMRGLDLQVGIDIYLNETHREADYVLPAATFLERDDLVLPLLDFQLTPFVQWTDAVVAPRGEARPDWQIINDLARELGFAPVSGPMARFVGTGRVARLAAIGARTARTDGDPSAAGRPDAAHRSRRRPVRGPTRRVRAWPSYARIRTGSCSPRTSRPESCAVGFGIAAAGLTSAGRSCGAEAGTPARRRRPTTSSSRCG